MAWEVLVHPDAVAELGKLPARERFAVDTALEKLRAIGPSLGYPHTSNVQCADSLRELRPRQGRCVWRAFYRDVQGTLVIAAVCPEATVNPRGFMRAVEQATARLDELEEDE